MGTTRCIDASFGFAMSLQSQFSYDAFHAFMIDVPSLPLQLLGDAPIAIAGPLASHRCNRLPQRLLMSNSAAMLIGAAGAVQDLTDLSDRILFLYPCFV